MQQRLRAADFALAGQKDEDAEALISLLIPVLKGFLTDKGFAARLRDLLDDREDVSQEDLRLLTVGRHVRLRSGLKVVIGRNEQDNLILSDHAAGTEPNAFTGAGGAIDRVTWWGVTSSTDALLPCETQH